MENKDIKANKERAVNLTWTWYIFLLGNVILILGLVISWGIYSKVKNPATANIPIYLSVFLALACIALFYFFDSRDLYLIRQHVPKKLFKIYFIAGFIFVIDVIFMIVYFTLSHYIVSALVGTDINSTNFIYGIGFGVTALISLISIGCYRYARFKIDIALYRRRHGEAAKQEAKPTDSPTTTDQSLASSGLTENADSKSKV